MNSSNWRNIIISGIIFAILAGALVAGVYLVRRPQSQSVTSKAASGATAVCTSPNSRGLLVVHYFKDQASCDACKNDPSDCISRMVGQPSDSNVCPQGNNWLGTTTNPADNQPTVCTDLGNCGGSCTASNLPSCAAYQVDCLNGLGGGINAGNRGINCDCGTPPSAPVCNSIALTPNDTVITTSSLARQVTASATGGSGTLTYTFSVTNTGGSGNGNLSQTSAGGAVATWTAPDLANVVTNQTWTITATAKDTSGRTSSVGGCTKTLTFSPQIAGAACQNVKADKELTTLKIGDTVNLTGYGSLGTDQGDAIDKIEFTLRKDNAIVSTDSVNTTRDPGSDSGNLKFWKAVKSYTISQPGSYSVTIRVHWKNQNVWKG